MSLNIFEILLTPVAEEYATLIGIIISEVDCDFYKLHKFGGLDLKFWVCIFGSRLLEMETLN